MLGNRRPADRQAFGQRADRFPADPQPLEYLAARRIGQSRQGGNVSHI
jgi:hypothetical protein